MRTCWAHGTENVSFHVLLDRVSRRVVRPWWVQICHLLANYFCRASAHCSGRIAELHSCACLSRSSHVLHLTNSGNEVLLHSFKHPQTQPRHFLVTAGDQPQGPAPICTVPQHCPLLICLHVCQSILGCMFDRPSHPCLQVSLLRRARAAAQNAKIADVGLARFMRATLATMTDSHIGRGCPPTQRSSCLVRVAAVLTCHTLHCSATSIFLDQTQ